MEIFSSLLTVRTVPSGSPCGQTKGTPDPLGQTMDRCVEEAILSGNARSLSSRGVAHGVKSGEAPQRLYRHNL